MKNVTLPSWLVGVIVLTLFVSALLNTQALIRRSERFEKLEMEVRTLKTTKANSATLRQLREEMDER